MEKFDPVEKRNDRGQAMPLTVLVVAFALLVALGVARLARETAQHEAAQHAADAAALAGAVHGEASAADVAAKNDAILVAFRTDGDAVTVAVARHGRRAEARAEFVIRLESTALPVRDG